MSLFNKKNLENGKFNKYGITEKDMIGELECFPVGIVVRMMEEQEKQGNEANVKVFQKDRVASKSESGGGFSWGGTEAKFTFWRRVLMNKDLDHFFKRYPEYEKYN